MESEALTTVVNLSADTAVLSAEHLEVSYRLEGGGSLPVLRDLNLRIGRNELVCVIGPSGCGKTTLLNVLAGLLAPTAGTASLEGHLITGPGRDRGMVFQQDAIFPWRTVIGNVEYGLELRRVPRMERRNIALRHLELVGLSEFATLYPKELSGGMRKRVAIAMVFANEPAVLLMDEPFGALDYPTKVSLQKELLHIWERDRKTMVFVTHDLEEALFMADRILVMVKGQLAKQVDVPFGRPRVDDIRADPEFQRIKMALWQFM